MRFLVIFAVAFAVLLDRTVSTNAALFAVASATFSGSAQCGDGVYTIADPAIEGRISKKKLSNSRLYFSFRIIGQDMAIAKLKATGALDVFVSFWAGLQKLGERSIGIDQNNWDKNGAALTAEQLTSGIFNWRTCAYSQQVDYSSINVQIRDSNMDFASPLDVEGSYQPSVIIDP